MRLRVEESDPLGPSLGPHLACGRRRDLLLAVRANTYGALYGRGGREGEQSLVSTLATDLVMGQRSLPFRLSGRVGKGWEDKEKIPHPCPRANSNRMATELPFSFFFPCGQVLTGWIPKRRRPLLHAVRQRTELYSRTRGPLDQRPLAWARQIALSTALLGGAIFFFGRAFSVTCLVGHGDLGECE